MLTKKPKYKLIEESYNKQLKDELDEKLAKVNEEKKFMKKPMDFDEIREFGIKVAQDRENLKETKRAEDETELKK